MDSVTVVEVLYGPATSHKLDLYVPPNSAARPLICFIHGGAWRAEDKAQHATMAMSIAAQSQCAVAVPNYRLTPTNPTPDNHLHHPVHAEDVLRALVHLHERTDAPYDTARMYTLGHSCGAHILSSIFLDSSEISPSLTPPPSLLTALRAVIVSEGIYDLDLLITSFPTYRDWFISNAFGVRDSFSAFSTTTFPLRHGGEHIRWFIIHSSGDTLVDVLQSQTFYDHLISIYEDKSDVVGDMDSLAQGHHDVLDTDTFKKIVTGFIQADMQK